MLLPTSELRMIVDEFYNSLHAREEPQVPSVITMVRRSLRDSEDCGEFVFSEQPWYHRFDERRGMFTDPSFLDRHGYTEIGAIENGVIVAYYFADDPSRIEHFGIVSDGSVISKWGAGPVFVHPFELIPLEYGDSARFFRRREPSHKIP